MKNFLLIFLIILIGAGGYYYFNYYNPNPPFPDNLEVKEKDIEEPIKEQVVNIVNKELPKSYENSNYNFFAVFPENWEGNYTVTEEENRITFKYKKQLLFFLTFFSKETEMFAINQMPNHEILIQNDKYIVALSQALDMPYEPGSEDDMKYGDMMKGIGEVKNWIGFNKRHLVNKRVRDSNEEYNYTVAVEYPEIDNGDFNEKIRRIIDDVVIGFRERVKEWGDPEFDTGSKNALYMWYKPVLLSDDIVSVKLYMSDYYSGAAHPNTGTAAFNYNVKEGREIEYSEIVDETKINKIKELVVEKLNQEFEKRGAGDFTYEGEIEISESSTINVSEGGFVITFDPYEVAPYAMGGFSIEILNSEL